MRKLLFISAVACIALISFSSCKKSYTCACTYTTGGQTITTNHEIKTNRKLQATAECLDLEMQYWISSSDAYCSLK